ncbi:uncharacterized protein LOC126838699 [Adelges cooleyi]|uniref:uncharacterized protein LOC126838699 n=1 Tax=Adelges cooleyi TaxID=133065 RepID=UPI0021805A47|nr:uncharacterized protein LOC126838699 [Adelges cooleyi]
MDTVPRFTESHISNVQRSWPFLVSSDFWPSFYIKLFQKYPLYQLEFDRFARVPVNELISNGHFLAHATRTGKVFDTTIGLLGDFKVSQKALEDLGEKHKKFRLTTGHFEAVELVLNEILTDRMTTEHTTETGSSSEELLESWKVCVSCVIGTIKEAAVVDTSLPVMVAAAGNSIKKTQHYQ